MIKKSPKIIYFGTSDFSAAILQGLVKNSYKPILVITVPDKPVGRKQILTPCPVKKIAQKYNIPIEQPEKIKDSLEKKIKNIEPDIGIVAAYGKIIPKKILEIPEYGLFNVHPSLLPKYRGPSPIQTAILDGIKKTGVTIFKINEKIDEGSIAGVKKILIEKNDNSETLRKKIIEPTIELLIELIPKLIKNEIKLKNQDHSKVSYTKIIKKEDGKINWNNDAEKIERKIKAFYPWPGTFCFWKKDKKLLRVKIIEAKAQKQNSNHPIGKVFLTPEKEPAVKCKKDYIILKKIQIEGKNPVSGKEFLRGNENFIGTILKY